MSSFPARQTESTVWVTVAELDRIEREVNRWAPVWEGYLRWALVLVPIVVGVAIWGATQSPLGWKFVCLLPLGYLLYSNLQRALRWPKDRRRIREVQRMMARIRTDCHPVRVTTREKGRSPPN